MIPNALSNMTNPAARILSTITMLALATGCSTVKDQTTKFGVLISRADSSLRERDLRSAEADVLALLAKIDTEEVEKESKEHGFDYGVQRAMAEALLVAINMSAGSESGSLKAPKRSYRADDISDETEEVSETAHRLAGLYHAWRLIDQREALEGAGGEEGKAAVPPERLRKLFGSDSSNGSHAVAFARMNIAGAYAQLGKRDLAAEQLLVISSFADLLDPSNKDPNIDEDLVQRMDQFGLPRNLQWHLLATCHDYYREEYTKGKSDTDRQRAYRIGCLVAFGRVNDEGGQRAHDLDFVEDIEWATGFSSWVMGLESDGVGKFAAPDRSAFNGEANKGGTAAIDLDWTPMQ